MFKLNKLLKKKTEEKTYRRTFWCKFYQQMIFEEVCRAHLLKNRCPSCEMELEVFSDKLKLLEEQEKNEAQG